MSDVSVFAPVLLPSAPGTRDPAAPDLIHGAAAGMTTGWGIAESTRGAGSGPWRSCGCRPGWRRRRWCGSCRRRGRRRIPACRRLCFRYWRDRAGPGRALRPAAGARLPTRLAARLPAQGRVDLDRARRGHRGGVGGGRVARPGRDRALRGGAQPAGVGGLLVARAPRLTADGGGKMATGWRHIPFAPISTAILAVEQKMSAFPTNH